MLAVLLQLCAAAPITVLTQRFNSYVGHTGKVSNAQALTWYNADLGNGANLNRATTDYRCYGGQVGRLPAISEWLSFEQLWTINIPVMRRSGNSDSRIGVMRQAVIDLSTQSRVDARLILVTMMQEVRLLLKVHI